jgi:hypothetical protein
MSSEIELEDVTHDPEVQCNIGRSQKCPVHMPTFLQKNKGDPTINVSVLHILLLLTCNNSSEAEFFAKVKLKSKQHFFKKLQDFQSLLAGLAQILNYFIALMEMHAIPCS